MQLQGVGTGIVLGKQCLTDFRNPLGSTLPLLVIDRFARPERDVVQVDKAGVGTAIYQCPQLAVADG